MVDEALRVNVLSWANRHAFGRNDVDHGRFPRVCVRNPYRNRETVDCATEADWEGAREEEEQSIRAVGEGYQDGLVLLRSAVLIWVGAVLCTSVLGDNERNRSRAWATSL